MKKFLSVLICAAMLLAAGALHAFAFGIDPRFQVDGESVYSLSKAFSKVTDAGSVIKQTGGDETVYSAEEYIEVTTDVTLITGKNFSDTVRRIEYSGSDKPLFTVKSGGKLTLRYSEIRLCDTDVVGNGKLIVVEQGGTLVLDGTDTEPVTFLDSSDSTGLILVKNGGTIVFFGATFNGNQSDGAIKVEDGGTVIGDLNGDRVIDGADYHRLTEYLKSPETVSVSVSPDCNLDGNVNSLDVSLMLDYLVKRASEADAVDISDKSVCSVSAGPDKIAHLRFTPKEDANCTFVLPNGEDTRLWFILCDENGNLIDCDYRAGENGSENGAFEITADFDAGTAYFLEIGTGADGETEFELSVPLGKSEGADGGSAQYVSSVLSKGDLTIIIAIAAISVACAAAIVIVKKVRPTSVGAKTDEE